MNEPNAPTLPPILTEKLTAFRKRVRVVKFIEGLLAALFGLALSYLLVFALDRFFETPGTFRAAILIAGAAVPGLGLPLLWHKWVWRQRRLEDVARLVRRHFPRLGDQLLGIVELAHEDHGSRGRSERLVQAAMDQAAERVKDRDLTEAVPNPKYRKWAVAAGLILILTVLAGALVPDAAKNALARWLTPWRDVERYTFVRLEPLPEKLVVPFAEEFELPAKLAPETKWSPETAAARIPGQPKQKIEAKDGEFPFAFRPQKEDTTIAIKVGDAREKVELQPRTRPELTDLKARLRLPDYLNYSHDPEIEVRGGTVRLLGGADVSWIAEASRDLAEGTVDGQAEKVEDGKLVTEFAKLEETGKREFHWRDTLGLTPRDPLVLKVQAVEDEAPDISARRESQEQVVLNTEVVTFDLSILDDFGVRRAGLEWKGVSAIGAEDEEEPVRGEKVAASGGSEQRDLEARATFCAAKEDVAPQTIEVRAWAEDFLTERGRAYSPTFVLHVLDANEHALWLTGQFGKWLEAARESYEREQQLHQTNKEMRKMTAADLDRPENRRKVAAQAAGEQANAARLDAIAAAGKTLVEHGTRNPEFDADRLESWATMIEMLDGIAEERMPSVAELLKDTAGARGGKPGQQGKPSESGGKPNEMAANNSGDSDPSKESKPGEASPGPSKPAGPKVQQGGDFPSVPGPPKPVDPDAEQPDPVPSIVDNETGFLEPPKPAEGQQGAAPKPPSKGKFGLPGTTLGAIGDPEEQESAPESPAQESLDEAITEQRDLLAEFAKVADQLQELLASLEASTFVKRLKAASRAQMEIAGDLNAKTLSAFGLERNAAPDKPKTSAEEIARRARDESETIYVIQSDLSAYINRKPDMRFTSLLEDMKNTRVVREIDDSGNAMEKNLSGQSIAGAEFWADTLDRWAEELVEAAQCSSCSSCKGDSLPPEIVLKVMQALRDEMALRDETRELENAKGEYDFDTFDEKALPLAEEQWEIGKNVRGVMKDIYELERGEERFGKEIQLLSRVTQVMDEAQAILEMPNTGPKAVAAETEAIELLLQARRMKPGGGGGGGSNPGGGSGAATASSAALAGLGPGSDANAQLADRATGQSTGRTGKEFPEEFRSGLDAYFNALEKEGAAAP